MIVVHDHVDNISAIVMRALQRINQVKSGTEYGHTSVCVWFSSLLSQFINQNEVLSSNAVHH
jgi:hypothetical protein